MIHWHYIAWTLAALCFGLALLGVFAAGMASRATTAEDYSFPKKCAFAGAVLILITLAACSRSLEPGIEVRTVEKVVEVQRPCPGTAPVRPAPGGPWPTDLIALAAALGAKLAEYSAPGKYADQVDAYVRACPPSPS